MWFGLFFFGAQKGTRCLCAEGAKYCVAAVEAGGKRMSTGHSHLMVRVLPSINKKYQIPEKVSDIFGTPKGTQTPDLLIRSG